MSDQAAAEPPPGVRAPIHRRPLTADERDQLQVLKAVTAENAGLYTAVLSVLVAAKERYEVQVRTERIVADLEAGGHGVDGVAGALSQLQDWGNVTWTQDTAKVAKLEDFHRRRELWQLTAAGHAAHDAVLRVLGAAERSGSLQRTLIRDIRDTLDALAAAVDGGDADTTYLRLRDLDGSLQDLAANARDFHATLADLRREHDADPERFLAYKSLLIEYLHDFLDHVMTNRTVIAGRVAAIEARDAGRVAKLAAAGDDSAGLFAGEDLVARWQARWDGLAAWFVGQGGARAGVDELIDATTVAVRELMAMLRRVNESGRRPITRASELVHTARWFLRLDDAAAHALFDAGFGLGRTQHLSQADHDPDATPSSASWWDAPPVPVPVTLRNHGRRPAPGKPGRATDYTATKARLAAEHARRRAERAEAAARLVARPVTGRSLSPGEFSLLLELLDRALHQRALDAAPAGRAEAEGARLLVRPRAEPTVLVTDRGSLTVSGVALEVEAV